jgi:hypothetical protein
MSDWYAETPPKAQAKFDKILDFLRDNPNNLWPSEWFKPLTGYDGIFEIRYKIRNILYRPLGFFGPNKEEFTFLVPAREQGNILIPRDAPALAVERRKMIERGEAKANECDF